MQASSPRAALITGASSGIGATYADRLARPGHAERSRAMFTEPDSDLTASMLRDVQRSAHTEAEHLLGDLLQRGDKPPDRHALLRVTYAHPLAYEACRVRTQHSVGHSVSAPARPPDSDLPVRKIAADCQRNRRPAVRTVAAPIGECLASAAHSGYTARRDQEVGEKMPPMHRERIWGPMPRRRRPAGAWRCGAAAGLALAVATALSACAPQIIEVGPTHAIKSPARAISEASDGDTVRIDPGVYEDCAFVTGSDVTIEGTGPGVVLTSRTCGGKAILVTRGDDITIRNLTLEHAAVRDRNGAGIRSEGVNLTVDHVRFLDNEEGILAGNKPGSTIRVLDSDFEGNGTCAGSGGCAHGVYVAHIKELDVEHSRFFDQQVGHHVKSRALVTRVIGNDIEDGPDGTASYEIDVPNGGSVLIEGNTLEKGPKAQNWGTVIAIGEEGRPLPSNGMQVRDNRLTNDNEHQTVFVRSKAPYPVQLSGNVLSGKVDPLQGQGSVQ